MIHPSKFPDGSSTYGGMKKAPPVTGLAGCSAFAARGGATTDGRTITAHNRHSPYDPRDYAQAFITTPPKGKGYLCWHLCNCPQIAANQVVNEEGLSIILFFGGRTNLKSLNEPGGPYFAEGRIFRDPDLTATVKHAIGCMYQFDICNNFIVFENFDYLNLSQLGVNLL